MKLWYSIFKEYKVLIRDKAGLAVMFLMPTVLILIITLIQDSTFRSVNESSVPLLLVDRDHDSLSRILEKSLKDSKFFTITKQDISNEEARDEVAKGHFLIEIVVPENTSAVLRERSEIKVSKMLAAFGGDSSMVDNQDTSRSQLQLYFDPITKKSFKTTISNAIERIVSQIEMQSMVAALNHQMKDAFPEAKPAPLEMKAIIEIHEEYASVNHSSVVPNSVQHNVPAWSMFAMFFICIPLAGNIIKEREDGSAFRLMTMPGSYLYVMMGKMLTYILVTLIQFILMLSVGLFILPMMGMPQLFVGDNLFILLIVAIAAGLAATGFGLLIGTVATSHDQASLSGAVLVIIFAAIGGVWVPTFVMPDIMKKISVISPLNWGLEAFYGVFLRNTGLKALLPEIIKLISFFVVCTLTSFYFQKYRRLK